MRRSELKRGKPLERKTPLRNKTSLDDTRHPSRGEASGLQGPSREGPKSGVGKASRPAPSGSTLKPGRGFSASKAQREKVRGMACAACGVMASESIAIDPAHVCSRGMGGCDSPDCVIPLCRDFPGRGCHTLFDRGELDIGQFLEPTYRAELAHAVMHLGLEGVRRRVFPSCYRGERAA